MKTKSPHPPAWTRWIRRLFRPFLNHEEKKRIAAAIEEIEKKTSAEIHVHIIRRMGRRDPLKLAQGIFSKLKLHEHAHRNGLLILLSHLDHRFAIWGDRAAHDALGDGFWKKTSEGLQSHFKARRYAEGLIDTIREMGRELEKHFPRT